MGDLAGMKQGPGAIFPLVQGTMASRQDMVAIFTSIVGMLPGMGGRASGWLSSHQGNQQKGHPPHSPFEKTIIGWGLEQVYTKDSFVSRTQVKQAGDGHRTREQRSLSLPNPNANPNPNP